MRKASRRNSNCAFRTRWSSSSCRCTTIIRSVFRRARIEAAPVAAIEQFQRCEARLVIHLRMACDPETQVDVSQIAFARQFDLAQDRAGAESACGFVRIEKRVDRGQTGRGEIGD